MKTRAANNNKMNNDAIVEDIAEDSSDSDGLPDLISENDGLAGAKFRSTLARCKRVACSGAYDGDLSGVVEAEQIMTEFLQSQDVSYATFWAYSTGWLEHAINQCVVPCVAALRGCGAEWPTIVGPGERESWRRQLDHYRQSIKDWQRQEKDIKADEEFEQSF